MRFVPLDDGIFYYLFVNSLDIEIKKLLIVSYGAIYVHAKLLLMYELRYHLFECTR